MNGALYPQPQGALMDPRQAMIMQMGLGLMAGSGPSRTPVSFGQTMGQAGMQGMNAYQQAAQAQQAEAFKRQQMEMQQEQLRLQLEDHARKASMPLSGGPGTQFIRPGETEPFHTVPFKPDAPQKPTPPMTRQVPMGDQVVTQEYVDGEWREVGRGARFQPVKPPAAPKAPTGFRYKPDSDELEPIPGGPKDTAPKDAARAAGAVQKADIVIGKVEEALKNTGFTSTGLTGKVLGMVPGTKAYDLDKTIDTIKAQVGFSELQAMREASPTGGALGQVAVLELQMLQSTIASLEHGQSEEQVRRALGQVKKHFENWKNAVQQSQQGQTSAPTAPTAPTAPKRRVYNPKSGKFE